MAQILIQEYSLLYLHSHGFVSGLVNSHSVDEVYPCWSNCSHATFICGFLTSCVALNFSNCMSLECKYSKLQLG